MKAAELSICYAEDDKLATCLNHDTETVSYNEDSYHNFSAIWFGFNGV